MIRVVVDCLGGDMGSSPIIQGVALALQSYEFTPILVGSALEIENELPKGLHQKVKIVHTDDFVRMKDSATDALRRKDSSIYKCMELLREKEADALVSAGHSGATMSLATLRVGRIKGVTRPAIATLLPRIDEGVCLLLDAGANVDCKAEHFYQFAVMGMAFCRDVVGVSSPKIGLISNGEEESKGNEQTREALLLMQDIDGFVGYIEGNNLFDGTLDVAVCDGFVGNVALKTSEGVGEYLKHFFKNNIKTSLLSTIGAYMMKPVFSKLKKRIDYAEYGGAPLLGIDGHVIISHGKSNSKAIKNAIGQAIRFASSNANEHIANALAMHARAM